jgi:hypothetical protein
MRRTKITYIHHTKSNYIQFLLPPVTGTKPNNVLVYKHIRRLQHAMVPTLRNHVQFPVRWLRLADYDLLYGSKSVGVWRWSFTSSNADSKKDNRSTPTHPSYSCLTP